MASLVRLAAVVAAVLVAASFALFAIERIGDGSAGQVEALRSGASEPAAAPAGVDLPAPPPAVERRREAAHSAPREAIDDANDVLVAPFAGILDTDSTWAARIVPALLGVLLYGLGGTLLANALPQSKRRSSDWREAAG
jgi:hypothetical protein